MKTVPRCLPLLSLLLPPLHHAFVPAPISTIKSLGRRTNIINYGLPLQPWDREDPAFDEYGLPLERKDQGGTGPDLKDVIYSTYDAMSGAVNSARDIITSIDPARATYQPSERRLRQIEESTENKIATRRFFNRVTSFKDGLLETLSAVSKLPHLPRRTWDRLVTEPLDRARQERLAQRRALEEALQRYYDAQDSFYDTIDAFTEKTKASVSAVRTVGKAIADTPGNVRQTVDGVKQSYSDARAAAGVFVEDMQRSVNVARDAADNMAAWPGSLSHGVQAQAKAVTSVFASVGSFLNKQQQKPATTSQVKAVTPSPISIKHAPPPVTMIWDPAAAEEKKEVTTAKAGAVPPKLPPTAVETIWESDDKQKTRSSADKTPEERETEDLLLQLEMADDEEREGTREVMGKGTEEKKEPLL